MFPCHCYRTNQHSAANVLSGSEAMSSRVSLQEGAGWAIIIGFGFVFSLITSLIVYIDYTFGGTAMTSEEFNTAGTAKLASLCSYNPKVVCSVVGHICYTTVCCTAGRNIKTGLTASVIVSQWYVPVKRARRHPAIRCLHFVCSRRHSCRCKLLWFFGGHLCCADVLCRL